MTAATLRAAREACPHWELGEESPDNPAGIITNNPGPCCWALEAAKRAQLARKARHNKETTR